MDKEKNGEPILVVEDVQRSFLVGGKELQVLKGVNLTVNQGSLVVLKGRSGSGKTTLLNILGGLDSPTKGKVTFQGQSLLNMSDEERTLLRRKRMGFIFQSYALMPLLSAWETVELALRMAGVPRKEWAERINYYLDLIGLGKRKDHRPYELSGGEQQRVAIARSLAPGFPIILADEPTANLDSRRAMQVMEMFKTLIERDGLTICMTTHDPVIMEVANEIYEMDDGKLHKIK